MRLWCCRIPSLHPHPRGGDLVTAYRKSIADLEQQDAQQAEEHEEQKPLTATEVLNFRRMFGEPWQKASEADRRKLLMEIIHNIVVYPDKLIIRTLLSLGDITIPTLMFEKKECPEPAKTSPRHSLTLPGALALSLLLQDAFQVFVLGTTFH